MNYTIKYYSVLFVSVWFGLSFLVSFCNNLNGSLSVFHIKIWCYIYLSAYQLFRIHIFYDNELLVYTNPFHYVSFFNLSFYISNCASCNFNISVSEIDLPVCNATKNAPYIILLLMPFLSFSIVIPPFYTTQN